MASKVAGKTDNGKRITGAASSSKGTAAGKNIKNTRAGKPVMVKGEAAKNTKGKSTKKQSDNRKKTGRAVLKKKTEEKGTFFNPGENEVFFEEAALILALVVSVLVFISYIGVGPEYLKKFVFGVFGIMAYPFPFIFFVAVAFLIGNRGKLIAYRKFASGLGIFISVAAICQAVNGIPGKGTFAAYYKNSAVNESGGGIAGALLYKPLYSVLGSAGSVIVIIALFLLCFMLFTGKAIVSFIEKRSAAAMKQKNEELRQKREALREQREYERELRRRQRALADRKPATTVTFNRNTGGNTVAAGIADATAESSVSIERVPVSKKKESYLESLKELGKKHINNENEELNAFDGTFVNLKPRKENIQEYPDKATEAAYENRYNVSENTSLCNNHEITGGIIMGPEYTGIEMAEIGLGNASAESRDVYEADSEKEEGYQELSYIEKPEAYSDDSREDIIQNISSVYKTDGLTEKSMESAVSENRKINTGATENTVAKKSTGQIAERIADRAGAAVDIGVIKDTGNEEDMIVNPVIKEETEYVFPPVELLSRLTGGSKGVSQKELHETATRLQNTLDSFGVRAKVTDATCGPAVTRYEITPEMGVKVSKITGLTDDIKLNLAAQDIRIEAPIPGKAAVGIEIPNREISTVSFRELVESSEYKESKSKVSFAVGKDIGGQVVASDIAKMPHLLIAGATGSGKSVCINTLIMSILYKAKPSEVRLIMIDPKVVELSVYNGIPHLLIPVVTEPKKASAALNWAVVEMDERYNKFSELGVRDLKGFNEKLKNMSDEERGTLEEMPQIVIIVDELADLMMVASNEVETAICRLAQKARAAGMHLIIATQRPSVNVITGVIKANIPSRIAFSVSSQIDSRTILDGAGAESLLGKGDMLLLLAGMSKPKRVQGAFVSDNEVTNVVEFLKANNKHTGYSEAISSHISNEAAAAADTAKGAGTKKESDKDDYFVEAGKFIIEKEKASIGALQRAYSIGFNRAARIMDQLFYAKVVGPEEGTKPRKILMTMEEFLAYVEENGL